MRRLVTAVLLCACACTVGGTSPPLPTESKHQGVTFVHRFTAGAGADAPLIVSLHGRGSSPENMATLWEGFPGRAEIALPQGLEGRGFGWQWFDWPPGTNDLQMTAAVDAAEKKLWPAIAELARGRPVVVTGFSQGAVMTYLIAERHPDEVKLAIPVAGMLPHGLFPRSRRAPAPLFALHGTDDDVLPLSFGQETVNAFQNNGATAELRSFPGIAHQLSPEMRQALWSKAAEALR